MARYRALRRGGHGGTGSYRLDEELKRELAARAEAEGINETTLVSRLLEEGLKTSGD